MSKSGNNAFQLRFLDCPPEFIKAVFANEPLAAPGAVANEIYPTFDFLYARSGR
jgi:hypothetical protein